jgi:hypothetical protein
VRPGPRSTSFFLFLFKFLAPFLKEADLQLVTSFESTCVDVILRAHVADVLEELFKRSPRRLVSLEKAKLVGVLR